ncbi:FTR1 family protein [Neoroseomonas soli]|uniref:Iron permease FTR1 n=1 Tax=Neoroseomonas soli TaxID=1081025 RepID=A0A9X9X2G1_9PROT|nr:iron permease FTR1 [Neoroseomonas soli]
MISSSVDAGLILFREGLEAILVLAALAAFLKRAAPERVGHLGWGAAAGVGASMLAAVAFMAWRGGDHDDSIEGIACLLAAGLMLWTGGWLARRSDPRAWSADLRRRAEAAIASRRVGLAVGAIGFLAIFREGAETILFLTALLREAPSPAALLPGLGVAAVVLAGVWVAITRLAVRLPLRPLFLGTSVFLLLMAVRLAAAAVQEFQEQTLIPFDPLNLPGWAEALGLPGNIEQAAAMVIVVLLALPALVAGLRANGQAAA